LILVAWSDRRIGHFAPPISYAPSALDLFYVNLGLAGYKYFTATRFFDLVPPPGEGNAPRVANLRKKQRSSFPLAWLLFKIRLLFAALREIFQPL
jgi:hypothetical protein